ncbi:hypothetical protein ACU5AY_01910 [Rhizobium sp. PAMB 3174]
MDYRHICTAGTVAHHDLLVAHEALEAGPESMNMRLVLIRHLILEIANIADIASISGALYKENPDLGKAYQEIRKGLEFFKYLRNVYVGHFVPDLTNKTFEWIPLTNALLGGEKQNERFGVSWFALETAINTYADPDTGHKVFDSDTDLNYPPDHTRFLNFLGDTVLGSMNYVTQLVSIARAHVDVADVHADMLQLAFAAGQTDFSVLRKGKR